MAARVAVIGLQLALVAWTQRNRALVGATFRSLAARLYGRAPTSLIMLSSVA